MYGEREQRLENISITGQFLCSYSFFLNLILIELPKKNILQESR